MPTTLTKLVTATIVLSLSAVVPGCSCSYSSSSGSKGTQAPTSTGKPINNDGGKPAGTSKASSGSQGTPKAVSKGAAADDAAPEPEAKPTSTATLSAAPDAGEPDPGPVSGKESGVTLSDKSAAPAGASTRTSAD